jgi:hypothetical protein
VPILPLYPLLKEGVKSPAYYIDAKSGISGAGAAKALLQLCYRRECKAYGVALTGIVGDKQGTPGSGERNVMRRSAPSYPVKRE